MIRRLDPPAAGLCPRRPTGDRSSPRARALRLSPGFWAVVVGVFLGTGLFLPAAVPVLKLTDAEKELSLNRWLEALEDPAGRLGILDVSEGQASRRFRPVGPRTPSYGYSRSTFWLRFSLQNPTDRDKLRLLEIAFPLLESIEVFVSRPDGRWDVKQMGSLLPFEQRDILHRNFTSSIFIPPGQTRHVYLKIHTRSSNLFPLRLWYPSNFFRVAIAESLGYGVHYGIILAFVVYSMFVYFSMRERNYLYLTFYVTVYGLLQMILDGHAFKVLWPGLPALNNYAMPTAAGLTVFFLFLFTREFLGIRKDMRVLNGLIRTMQGFGLAIVTIGFLFGYSAGAPLAASGALVSPSLGFGIGVVCRYRGHRYARYYLAATMGFFVFATLYSLSKFGLLESNMLTENGLYIGSTLMIVFLFFAVPDKLNGLQAEKQEAQAELIQALRKAEELQEEFNAELRNVNRTLELKVEERTQDLAAKNMALTLQQEELQKAYDQLSRVDRMKTDFLSAVSHELRTPLTSILGFAKIIDRDYRKVAKSMSLTGVDPGVEKSHQRIFDDLRIIILEVERLSRLISNVLDLAKMDAGKMEWHDGVHSAEEMLQNCKSIGDGFFYTKPDVHFTADIGPDLGSVRIDRDRFIQVINNLFSNSAKYTRKGFVRLTASRDGDGFLHVSVSDSGTGIPPEALGTIFEKFQQVGDTLSASPVSGTGLGLTISQEIVEHYGGRIWVESELGKGSTFHLRLPFATEGGETASQP